MSGEAVQAVAEALGCHINDQVLPMECGRCGIELDADMQCPTPKAAVAAAEPHLTREPSPTTTEWGRAFRRGDGTLFVDDDDGTFRDADDVAQFVRPAHPESPYDLIVSREVAAWTEVEREGQA